MASDLSQIIKDILSSTLETTISKKTDIKNSFNITKDYFKTQNIVAVSTSFDYEKFTSNLKIIIPAKTASFIFNCMMMEEGELETIISDDIADAVKEVVSQISGGLETAINTGGFEDLGSTKFSVGDFQILNGSDYENENKLILFKLTIEENEFDLYIDFDNETLPFIENILNSDTLENKDNDEDEKINEMVKDEELSKLLALDDDTQNEEATKEVALEELSKELTQEDTKKEGIKDQENKSDDDKKDTKQEEQADQNIDDKKEEIQEDKKQKRLKLLIIIVSSILALVVIGFIIAYFMGVFDPPPPPLKQENNSSKKDSIIIVKIKDKQIDYKNSMINEKRLNKRLSLLTKYEILEEDILEKFKLKEKERLHKLRMERLEEFAKNNKEESLFKSGIINSKSKKDRFLTNDSFEKMQLENEKLTFIQIAPLKYKKYKNIILAKKEKSTPISICKDESGKIQVYIGPMFVKYEINSIVKNIKKTDKQSDKYVKLLLLTQKEFDKACDF